MTSPTPKIARIAASIGTVSADQLHAWLEDPRYSQDDVARLLAISPLAFGNLLKQPDPVPVVVTTQHVEG